MDPALSIPNKLELDSNLWRFDQRMPGIFADFIFIRLLENKRAFDIGIV